MNQALNEPFSIIMVDDDDEDIYTMRRAFSSVKEEVRFDAFSSGEAFFEFLEKVDDQKERDPDIIILDLNLPTVSGYEILDKFRKGHRGLRGSLAPVIILSTSDTNEDATRCYLLGANAVFTKPTNFEGTQRIAKAIFDFWRTEGIRRIGQITERS